jgi:hypothetical protein
MPLRVSTSGPSERVDSHALDPAGPAAGDRDLDKALPPGDERPERRGGEVAERRTVGTGKDGRSEAPAERDPLVAQRVDAPMQPVQPAAANPLSDAVVVDSARSKLLDGHHAILLAREPRGTRVRWFVLRRHRPSRTNHPLGHDPIVAGRA